MSDEMSQITISSQRLACREVEAANRRSDLFEKRRSLMADLASYCEQDG
jgi:hypothetical protein